MTLDDLQHSLTDDRPPAQLSSEVRALWHDARGEWDAAHRAVQDLDTADAAWVHAYLHRKEGDVGNARYWYGRARRPACTGALDAEWQQIARALLGS
jgi:hypothetical protein